MSYHNASPDDIRDWMLAFNAASDTRTITYLEKFYTKGASLRFANDEPLFGLDAISAFFDATLPFLKSIRHTIINLDLIGNKLFQTNTITYKVADDPQNRIITIPAIGVFHLVPEGDFRSGKPLIEHLQVLLDRSEVFGIVAEVQKLKAEERL